LCHKIPNDSYRPVDETVACPKYAHSTCETDCKDQASSCIKFGSINNAILNDKNNNILSDTMPGKYTFSIYIDAANKSKLTDILSKSRTILIQGREDDESMAPQNIQVLSG
jgi:hypothetical protein